MDSDEENRLLYDQQLKSCEPDGFDHHQMIENKKENQGFDQESSDDEEEKMSEKPFSSYSKLHGERSKIKSNGASGSAQGSGSSVRVCDFCGKQFNSGKALGGHRRYHIQAQKKLEVQNQAQQQRRRQGKVNYTLTIKPKEYDNNNNNNLFKSNVGNLNSSSSRSFRCCVCDKDFPSEKSLYGHMRSHPEREWRGMNPPFTADDDDLDSSPSAEQLNNGSSSSTLEESSTPGPVDLSSSCSGSSWLKKDKRGRKIIGEAEAAHIAAHILIRMHLCGNDELEPQNICCWLRDEPTSEEAALLPVKKRKNNVMEKNHVADYVEKLEGRDGNDDLEAENNMWDVKVISLLKEKKLNKKMNKKLKLGAEMIKSEGEPLVIRTVEQEVKPSQRYVCDICNKSFPCFQALGGHKSKHNREKNMAKSIKGKEVVEQREEEDKICINGALLSSVGLSGEEEEEEEEEASLISSEERLAISSNDNNEDFRNEEKVGEASQPSGSKIRSFDLNVPYVLEHEATDI